jgi:hypothetical protein
MLPSFTAEIIAVYSDYFKEEETLEDLLDGIDKKMLLEVATFFLNIQMDKQIAYSRSSDFISKFFSSENASFASKILLRTRGIENKTSKEGGEMKRLHFITKYTSLVLFETSFSSNYETKQMSYAQAERRIFKAILLINQESESGISLPEGGLKSEVDFRNFFFSMAFWQWDIQNSTPKVLLVTETVKSIFLFEFFEKHSKTDFLLKAFENHFGVKSWREFFLQIMGLMVNMLVRTNTGNIVFELKPSDVLAKAIFERISLKPSIEGIHDFVSLRAQPVLKIDDSKYRIVFDQFFMELLHQGMYFRFSKLNSENKSESISNFRSFYCLEFSEKHLFYSVLKSIYGNRYKQFSGKQLDDQGVIGAPDYYIRNGNKIFLFESKDVMINANIKTSKDPDQILKALKEKFLTSRNKPKAVVQLVNCIESIYSQVWDFDKTIFQRTSIYPIVIVHHRLFSAPAINHLLSEWFEEELDKRGLPANIRNRIKPITLILIDDLIFHQDKLQSRKWKLEDLIDGYHRYRSPGDYRKDQDLPKFISTQNRKFISFSDYLEYWASQNNEHQTPRAFSEKCNSIIESLTED